MNSTASALLSVREIRHSFSGLQVLRGVNFDVPAGTFMGLIGPNGAGKSTLFNIISGFLAPLSGTVHYSGEDVSRHSVQERSRGGLVRTFQTPKVFQGMTTLENLLVGCHKKTRSGIIGNLLRTRRSRHELEAAHTQAEAALDRFGLREVKEQITGTLPGGMQRMVELARAYLGKPKLLMLDEPSSGLNSAEIIQLKQVLQSLNTEGMTILLVSHDMDLVREASLIHVLCFGEIIATGPMNDIQEDSRVREAYLGV